MLDPAIEEFLNDRKEKWLKSEINSKTTIEEKTKLEQQAIKKFSLDVWLPFESQRAKQIAMTSHPAKFTFPSIKKEQVNFTVLKANCLKDGFIRTGNIETDIDAFGGAAGLPAYEFLSIKLRDGKTVLQHLIEETDEIKEQLNIPTSSFSELRKKYLSVQQIDYHKEKTHERIKQVYFPVEINYHLLSILTPSGIMFKLKERIDNMRFSVEAKEARESKKKNIFSSTVFSDIYDLSIIGFGGTKPQNISVLNSQNRGEAYLLPSMPPELTPRNIQPPKTNFFSNTIWPNAYKIDFQKLHTLLIGDLNNMHIRNKRDRITKSIIYQVVDKMWMVRNLDIGWSESENYGKLPKYQKIWLDQRYSATRNENQEWLDDVKSDFTRWFINTYTRILGKNALSLGDEQLPYFKDIIDECEEVLR